MTRSLNLLILCLLLSIDYFGQTPLKRDARFLFSETLQSLKNKDSIGFKIFFFKDTTGYCCSGELEFEDFTMTYPLFHELREHLEEVLTKNLKKRKIIIEKIPLEGSTTDFETVKDAVEYWITAEYKLSRDNYRSITFSCAYYNKKLLILASMGMGYTIVPN